MFFWLAIIIYAIALYALTIIESTMSFKISFFKELNVTFRTLLVSWGSGVVGMILIAPMFAINPIISIFIIFIGMHIIGIRYGRTVLRDYIEPMNIKIETAKTKLSMTTRTDQAEAIMLLSKMDKHPEAIALLCRTLHDSDNMIREQAAKALTAAFSQAYTIVFRNNSLGMTQRDLKVPVFETLLLPRKIIIDPTTCDMRQVEAFAAFTLPGFPPDLLAKFTVFIEGNPSLFASPVYRIFHKCKAVEIAIDTVRFGVFPLEETPSPTLWQHPDVLQFQLPLRRLRRIEIDADTANPIEIERFLTYALEYMGQEFLRLNVVAQLRGSPDALSKNLRNNLSNLCKRI